MSWTTVDDYQYPGGWRDQAQSAERARWCCGQLEEGQVLFFSTPPFDLPEEDRQFLLSQKQSGSQLHKNISYRPRQDILRGFASDQPAEVERLHDIMRRYSTQTTQFLTAILAPYAPHWTLDFASFRPQQESGRDLPLHKRNDLLHVDAFPTRPTQGGRILRVFTNINPTEPRVWLTADRFDELAKRFAVDAGLSQIAAGAGSPGRALGRGLMSLKRAVGMRAVEHAPYDQFMLRFHDYLKERSDFQEHSDKTRLEFPPMSTWLVFTDGVPHAALSGQYALEQTYIVPLQALVNPERSPLRILEAICGRPLANGTQKANGAHS